MQQSGSLKAAGKEEGKPALSDLSPRAAGPRPPRSCRTLSLKPSRLGCMLGVPNGLQKGCGNKTIPLSHVTLDERKILFFPSQPVACRRSQARDETCSKAAATLDP